MKKNKEENNNVLKMLQEIGIREIKTRRNIKIRIIVFGAIGYEMLLAILIKEGKIGIALSIVTGLLLIDICKWLNRSM